MLYRACWRLGAVGAPVHHQAGPAEVEAMLATIEPRVWLEPSDVRGAGARLTALLTDGAAPVVRSAARPADVAVVLFTSGSTGAPKAVLHTQRGLACKARMMIAAHRLMAADSVLMPAPLAHVSGLLNAVLIPGVLPMKAALMARWDPDDALDAIGREGTTFMIGPPTFFVSLMGASSFDHQRVASLRIVSSGGAGVTPAFVERASAELGAWVKRTYGSTEAPTVTTSTPTDPPDRARDTDGRATSPHLRMRIAGGGELWLRGPELFAGYASAEQTRAAVTRGWFHTGDVAAVDDDGWLTIVGRIKDIIIRGGENIAAAEVEGVLEAHPDVRQAVAVGVPDDRLGEQVCAFVVTAEPFDLDACRRWFAERGVARFKTPERIVVIDELPVLAAGKPDRAALARRTRDLPR